MNRDSVIKLLRQNEAELKQRGVRSAALFGSHARSGASEDSDIDIFIELDPAVPLGVWEYAAICDFIGTIVPGRVDVSNRAKLKDYVRPSAENDAIFAF